MTVDHLLPEAGARTTIAGLADSKIREIADVGMGRPDVLAFWFGESDQPTPEFIREAAIAALRDGRTFYTQNMGIPPLRAAIAAYVSRVHGSNVAPERIAVTSSGVNALMIAMQSIVSPGDRVVAITPVWPNIVQIPRILGAEVHDVALESRAGFWHLDVDALLAALTPQTRLLLIASPGNPTGWQIDPEQQARILAHCRRHGIWIVADEVYERLSYRDAVAPSFVRLADANDRVIAVNSFSKSWSMTGWRLGWIVLPARLAAQFPKLMEFNTSCAPEFVQIAGVVALEKGEAAIEDNRERLRASRDLLLSGLRRFNSIEAPMPDGGMYVFFRVQGATDSVAFAKRLVLEAGLGLAPGAAFGPAGEGYIRWCFAATPERLTEGLARLGRFLAG
jgi:aspartate/methionine/tyrosine aminotransferase